MKLLIILIGLLMPNLDTPTLEEVRVSFARSNDSEVKAEEFLELTQQSLGANKAVFEAYHGAALVLKASHCSIFYKLSNFKKGKQFIEQAVLKDPKDLEIRMIRLAIQVNVPSILGYNKEIDEDKSYILKYTKIEANPAKKAYLEGFIKDSGIF